MITAMITKAEIPLKKWYKANENHFWHHVGTSGEVINDSENKK